MRKYARYKDSGISWIGDVPEHWNCLKIKRLFEEDDEKNENGEFELLSFSKNKGLIYYKDNNEKEPSAGDLTKYRVVHKGQLLENRMQAWHGMFICVDKEGCVSPDYSVFNANKRTVGSVKYYEYCFRLPMWVQQFANESRGIGDGFNRLYTSQFHKIMAIVPPPSEQKAIAEYLDKKTAQINELVSAKQKQIELLKEYKQSVIANAVTGKMNKNRRMKDSGISWIGKIPENWEVKRVASFFDENKVLNKDFSFKKAYQFKFGTLVMKNEVGDEKDYEETYVKYTVLKKNDIVLNGLNLNYDFVSQRVAICPTPGIITSAYIAMTPRKTIEAMYYLWLFKTMDNKKMLHGMGSGIRLTLSFSDMKNQRIPVPPLSEQKEIVAYIEKKVSFIDSQIASIEKQIVNLNEYKQSLISDVVTGKVKVC